MQSRKEALDYGLAFPDTYVETPFRDTNWQLVRVKCSKKAFLWIYEKDGYVNLNVKADKEWRDYWRSAFKSVIPGWHQNKDRLPIAGCTARSCRRMVRPRPQRHALPSSAGRRCRLPAGPCRQRFPRPTPMPPRVRCGRFRRNRSNRRSAVAAARVRTCRTWSDRLYRHAKPWPASRARSSPIRPRTAEPDVRRGW